LPLDGLGHPVVGRQHHVAHCLDEVLLRVVVGLEPG